jgi:hypothetical protein
MTKKKKKNQGYVAPASMAKLKVVQPPLQPTTPYMAEGVVEPPPNYKVILFY